jgi:WD40 repeat protein
MIMGTLKHYFSATKFFCSSGCARFAPNPKLCLTGLMNSSIILSGTEEKGKDKGKPKILRTFRGHRGERWASFCGMVSIQQPVRMSLVVSASEDGSVYIWDLQDTKIEQSLSAHQGTLALLFIFKDLVT